MPLPCRHKPFQGHFSLPVVRPRYLYTCSTESELTHLLIALWQCLGDLSDWPWDAVRGGQNSLKFNQVPIEAFPHCHLPAWCKVWAENVTGIAARERTEVLLSVSLLTLPRPHDTDSSSQIHRGNLSKKHKWACVHLHSLIFQLITELMLTFHVCSFFHLKPKSCCCSNVSLCAERLQPTLCPSFQFYAMRQHSPGVPVVCPTLKIARKGFEVRKKKKKKETEQSLFHC